MPFKSKAQCRKFAELLPERVDGLHPSGEMYRRWVEVVVPEVVEAVR